MKGTIHGVLRTLAVAICALSFPWNAEARDLFSAYFYGNFDAVRKHLNVATFETLDRSGKGTFLNIAYDVYSQKPNFPLSELAALYKALSRVRTFAYTRKRLKGLSSALGDPQLLKEYSEGRAMVRLNDLASRLGRLKGFVVPHDLYARLAVIGLYAMRGYKKSGNEGDFLIKGYAASLRGRTNYYLKAYLKRCEACVYRQQVKRIVRDKKMGGVGIGPYLVNAEPYVFGDKKYPTPVAKLLPTQFRNLYVPTSDFQQFINLLKAAVKARDARTVPSRVADDFSYARDFGGMVTASMSPSKKFQQAYMLDNTKLADEYKDHGWNSLFLDLQASKYQLIDGQACGPAEPDYPDDLPTDYLFHGGYIDGAGVRVRAVPSLKGGIVQTLSNQALLSAGRVKDETGMLWTRVILRNREVGYVASRYFGGFLTSKLCFRKIGAKWHISSFIGGGD